MTGNNHAKIKVIHVITMLELGGAQGNTLFTVTHLDRAKFDVGLIAGPGGILDGEAKKIPDLSLQYVPSLVRPIRPIQDFLCVFQLIQIFKREKPDIVHTHSSKAGILGRIAAKLAGVPKIIHSIHGFGFNPVQKFPVRWVFIFLEIVIAWFTDVLIAVSQNNIEEGLRRKIGRRDQYLLLRSGVDIQKIKQAAESTNIAALKKELGIPEGKKIVLSIGPFKIQKDPVTFVEIARRVIQKIPETLFLWSGDGNLRPQVESKIRGLQLENSIKILGWRREIPALLKMSDIFVLTSQWEGLPRSGVEALIVGKPVVAFAVDGVPEIVQNGKNGFLLEPRDKDHFAERLIQILSDEALAKKMSEVALNSIDESFDINGMVKRQEELYERILARRA